MEIEKFHVKTHPRYDYRNWLVDNFSYFNETGNAESFDELEKNKQLILEGAKIVLDITYKHSGRSIVEYYKNDLKNITESYKTGSIDDFAKAVKTFKEAIDFE